MSWPVYERPVTGDLVPQGSHVRWPGHFWWWCSPVLVDFKQGVPAFSRRLPLSAQMWPVTWQQPRWISDRDEKNKIRKKHGKGLIIVASNAVSGFIHFDREFPAAETTLLGIKGNSKEKSQISLFEGSKMGHIYLFTLAMCFALIEKAKTLFTLPLKHYMKKCGDSFKSWITHLCIQ